MKQKILFSLFNKALAYNFVLFLIDRISKTVLTCILYMKLNSTDFTTWSIIFSLVYLLALWCNFGLSKSLPRFIPEYSHNIQAKKKFIAFLIVVYASILFLINIGFWYSTAYLAKCFALSTQSIFFSFGCAFFFLQSIICVVRLIFYAHFWNKQFNILQTAITLFTTLAIILQALLITDSSRLLLFIFTAHLIASSIIAFVGFCMLPFLYRDPHYQLQKSIKITTLTCQFAKHSAIMWVTTIAHSLTERNALILFISCTMGHHTIAMFKIANDAALLFERFILRIISTTGTILLSHIESGLVVAADKTKFLWHTALIRLNKRIIILTIPLFGIISLISSTKILPSSLQEVLQLFIVLCCFYLFEILFMAFSIVIEVKRDYKVLCLSLVPYFILLSWYLYCLGTHTHLPISFLPLFIIGIHSIRLISLSIKTVNAYRLHNAIFPFSYAVQIAYITFLLSSLTYIISLFLSLS